MKFIRAPRVDGVCLRHDPGRRWTIHAVLLGVVTLVSIGFLATRAVPSSRSGPWGPGVDILACSCAAATRRSGLN